MAEEKIIRKNVKFVYYQGYLKVDPEKYKINYSKWNALPYIKDKVLKGKSLSPNQQRIIADEKIIIEQKKLYEKYGRTIWDATKLFEYVKTHDEYNKTLFVLYGDHAAQLSKSQFNYFINYDFETGEIKTEEDPTYVEYDYYANELFKNTPLILWSKDKKVKGTYSYPMGMIDVLPTISNMLGIKNEYALGHDIFEVKNNNVVVFPNGNFLTNKMYYYNSRNESRIFGMETIDADYIEERKKYAEDILDISNDIIIYDLIEKASNRIGETANEQKE